MARWFFRFTTFCLLCASGCEPLPELPPAEPVSSEPARKAEPAATSAPSETAGARNDELDPKLPPLQKQDLVEGEGPPVKPGDRVRVHYTGTLLDGTKFDSSHDRGVPFDFVVGAGSVIAGWDLGVVGMKQGGKRQLTVPPHLAYGRQGAPPKIGPDAWLRFDIELLEIEPGGAAGAAG